MSPSPTGGDVRRRIEGLAPPVLAESWDNVGWQIGYDNAPIRAILVTLDVDEAVANEAESLNANLIVAHHPMFFRGMKRINPTDFQGRLLKRFLSRDIFVFAAHTNLDAVRGGVNDALAEKLNLIPTRPLTPVREAPEAWGFGAVCESDPVSTAAMARRVAEGLESPHVRVTPSVDGNVTHTRIALLGGSGGSMLGDVQRTECTLFITGEMKYHDAQDAARMGISVIEADHFYSERPVLDALAAWLAPLGVPVHVSQVVTTPFDAVWKETP